MAIVKVTGQSASAQINNTAATCAAVLPVGATAGNLLILTIAYYASSPAATPITDNIGTNTWVQAGAWQHTNYSGYVGIFYAANCAAGTKTITWHQSATAYLTLGVAEFSGVATSSPLDVVVGTAAAGLSMAPGSITPTVAGDLLIFAGTDDAETSTSTPTSFTRLAMFTTGQDIEADHYVAPTTAPVNATSTLGVVTTWAALIAAFKAATGGGTNLTYSGSGSVSVAGTSPAGYTCNYALGGGGSLTLTGVASTTYTRNYTGAGSGSVAISGSASTQPGVGQVGSGSIAITGAASTTYTRTYSSSGSGYVSITGTAGTLTTAKITYAGSGLLAIQGSSASGYSTRAAYAGSGTISLTGTSLTSYARSYVYAGSGSLAVLGSASTQVGGGLVYAGSGSIHLTGASLTSYTRSYTYTGSGVTVITGGSTTQQGVSCVGSGSMSIQGTAVCSYFAGMSCVGSGSIGVLGTSQTSYTCKYLCAGDGYVLLAGSATTNLGVGSYPVGLGSVRVHARLDLGQIAATPRLIPTTITCVAMLTAASIANLTEE